MVAGHALISSDPEAAIQALQRGYGAGDAAGGLLSAAVPGTLATLGRFAEAAELQRTVVKHRHDDASAWFNLALLEMRTGNSESAVAAARRAVDLRPDLADMHVQLALSLDLADAPIGEVIAGFERALAVEPNNAKIRAFYARSLYRAGRKEDGYREAVRVLKDDFADAQLNVFLAQKVFDRDPLLARAAFLRAAAARPDNPDLPLMAAVASAAAGDGKTALELALRAETLAEKTPISAHLGGEIEKIRSAFGDPLSLDPPPPAEDDPLDIP